MLDTYGIHPELFGRSNRCLQITLKCIETDCSDGQSNGKMDI